MEMNYIDSIFPIPLSTGRVPDSSEEPKFLLALRTIKLFRKKKKGTKERRNQGEIEMKRRTNIGYRLQQLGEEFDQRPECLQVPWNGGKVKVKKQGKKKEK